MPFEQLLVHGKQDKHEEFGYISLSNGSLIMKDFVVNILIATAAANTGIDKDNTEIVIRKGVPRDVITLLQERGRNARQAGMNGAYFVYTTWPWFVTLLLSMALPLKAPSNDNNESDGINSANVSRSPQARALRANKELPLTHFSPLSSTEIYNNVVQSYDDVIDILNLKCLPDLGCVHTRIECYLQCGFTSCPPPIVLPCQTQCHVLNGSCQKHYFL